MDARTRELERRWRESGDRAQGVRYLQALIRSGASEGEVLRARVEVGELSAERLRLAALLGHSGARAVSSVESLELTSADLAAIAGVSVEAVRLWGRNGCPHVRRGGRYAFELSAVMSWREGSVWGRPEIHWPEVCAQVCPEALWVVLLGLVERFARTIEGTAPGVAAALRAWVEAPGPERRAEVEAAARASRREALGWVSSALPGNARHDPLHVAEVRRWIAHLGLERTERQVVAGPALEWALSLDLGAALEEDSRVRARLVDDLSVGFEPKELTGAAAELAEALRAGSSSADVVAWFRSLGAFGAQPVLRGVLAVARSALKRWRKARPDDLAGDAVVLGLERCVQAPTADAVEALRASAEPMRQAVIEAQRGRGKAGPEGLACGHVLADAALVLQASSSVDELVRDATETAALALGRVSYARGEALRPRELVEAIRAELRPWLHGYDPLG